MQVPNVQGFVAKVARTVYRKMFVLPVSLDLPIPRVARYVMEHAQTIVNNAFQTMFASRVNQDSTIEKTEATVMAFAH